VSTAPALATSGPGHPPRHVAIIMDGNGRWAKRRHLPRVAGHKKGVDIVKDVVGAAGDLGIEVLTLYAFSTENWRRPEDEVSDLMGLLRVFIKRDIEEICKNGVKLRVIGAYQEFALDLVQMIDDAIARTKANTKMTLVIALNYGSQAEITAAVQSLAAAAKAGRIDPSAITSDHIEQALSTKDLPPVDLLIRTSGEERLSNFLLWQLAYAELMFVETLWPDFGRDALALALGGYAERERRFGGL
jgi:undecaprenyl diphosphate synthase